MDIQKKDRDILRSLAEDVAKIAALPDHAETAELWRRMNDLDSVRPMVRIYQLPWRELNVDGELDLQTEDPWAQAVETGFRRMLYQWRHMRYDMVVEPVFTVSPVIHNTDIGIKADMDQMIRELKGGALAEGATRIYVHGDKEFEEADRRTEQGIPLGAKVEASLKQIAADLGIQYKL